MRLIALTFVVLAGCASTEEEMSAQKPHATYSSKRPAYVVTTCVRDRLNVMDWALCPKATAYVLQKDDRSEVTVEGERGVDAIFEGQQQGNKSVYELRMGRQADLGLCHLSGQFTAVIEGCL